MKRAIFVLLFFVLTKVNAQNYFAGGGLDLTYSHPTSKALLKGTYENIQGAFFYSHSVYGYDMGFQVGYNFYNKNGILIGSNMAFSQYISIPSLNIQRQVSDKFFLDLNLRPSNQFFTAEIALLYGFK